MSAHTLDATTSVGTEIPELALPKISRTTLALFAGASGDHNPTHLDLDVARSAGLDDVFAQGMLSMAYLGRMLTNWVPQDRIRSFRVRFIAVTPVLGEPTCRGEVTAIEDGGSDGERLATLAITATLPDGTVTLLGEAVVALAGTDSKEL